jgi:hypothetical protein
MDASRFPNRGIKASSAMAAKNNGMERLCDLLRESFTAPQFEAFLKFKGYGEVLDAVRTEVSGDQFFFNVVRELNRRGLINEVFFEHLRQERPGKQAEISDAEGFYIPHKLNPYRTLVKTSKHRLILCLLAVFGVGGIASLSSWKLFSLRDQRTQLSHFLSMHDPELFPNREDRSYEIARIFPDRRSLSTEADLGATIARTTTSFDMLVGHGSSVIIEYRSQITKALERGVYFRILLLDPVEVSKGTHDKLIDLTTSGGQDLQERRAAFLARIRQVAGTLKDIKREATDKNLPGSLAYKFMSVPVLYRMWMRDIAKPDNAMLHITIHQYRSNSEFPSFRFTYRESERLMQNIQKDFERAWELSKAPLSEAGGM